MSTGGSHAPLAENMSELGVPVMTKKSFKATEKAIGHAWWDALEESMKEAAEENRNAIERDSLHEGVPAIPVIIDGGWSKRSHKHSYNAKSGAGIIIGAHTGKLLHVGVRNKYCSVCARSLKHNTEPQKHDCYMNWDGPSSSMVTDILVQGFKEAETKYGLRYTTFTGDGNSSVHASLVTQVPGWGHVIRKAECAKHAVKCYRGALERLVMEKPHYKGRGKLTTAMRKRLTTAARCAINLRSAESDANRATELLRQDLRNGPLHCFGIHSYCSTDYCKVVRSSSTTTNAYLQAKVSSSPSIATQPSGLVIHLVYHWLAASPDDLAGERPCIIRPIGIAEHKNPYKFKSMSLIDAANQAKDVRLAYNDGSLSLKRTHMYYQVQATMFCTQRKWCDFVVRTSTELHIERLHWDSAFWSAAKPRLRDFYFTAVLPELALPNLHKGGIREPTSWLKDAGAWRKETEEL